MLESLQYDKKKHCNGTDYLLATGNLVWGPTAPSESFDLYGLGGAIAYGTLYSLGYAGVLHAFNISTGDLLFSAPTNAGGENGPYPDGAWEAAQD